MPTEQISRYLYAASSEARVPSKFTRNTEASVVPSTATHMSPTSSVVTARSIVNTNRWKRSEEHTSELQSRLHLVCRLLLEKKKKKDCREKKGTSSTKE